MRISLSKSAKKDTDRETGKNRVKRGENDIIHEARTGRGSVAIEKVGTWRGPRARVRLGLLGFVSVATTDRDYGQALRIRV